MRIPATSHHLLIDAWKIVLAFFLVTITGWCHAEAKLKAYVVLDIEKGNPVPQVAFSADGQHEVSLSDGSFEMRFAQRNPGDLVRLVMRRPGWDVVNRYALDHTLISGSEPRPLEIIIAKTAEYEQKALAFYRLKGTRAVDQEAQRKLADLQRTNKATTAALTQLQRERDQARRQVDEFARQLAKAKPGETGQVYDQALKFFLDGKPDQAMELLSESRLEDDATSAQEKIKANAKEWQLRAQILVTKFDFAGASRAYKRAIELLPDDTEMWFQYAFFNQNQNQWNLARQGYERALRLHSLNPDQEQIAKVQNNLGILYREENRKAEARAAYENALTTYRKLTHENPDVYLPYVAMSLNNLGNLHNEENRKAEARAAHGEALVIYRQLAVKNPEGYSPDVAMS